MGIEKGIFNRTSLLLGDDVMDNIYKKRVIIFGLGGVGSWCAESLVRSGIKELVLVDSDRVCVTNVNRQLMATTKTVGKVKKHRRAAGHLRRSEYRKIPAGYLRLHY